MAKSKSKAAAKQPTQWKNRIVSRGEENPEQLLANPENWRIHSMFQEDALEGVLQDVGWVRGVLVNKRTGHVVDGHLRVALAIKRGEPRIPVDYCDLSVDEERKILLTIDPIAALAGTDRDKLTGLMADVSTGSEGLQAMLSDLADGTRRAADRHRAASQGAAVTAYRVVVECADESSQSELLSRLTSEGLTCRGEAS